MSSNIEKVKSIFKSPGIAAVLRWSKCVHVKVVAVCLITVLATVFSLFFTLATKGLVDGAVSSNSDQLVKYALMLVGIILMQHLLSNVRSWLRIHASAELQESLQKMLVHEVLSKEYGGLKGYHSGELVNRVFSDMSVIKNGIMSILPSLIGIVVSFVGAAGILIAMDWHFVILMLAGGALGLALVILFRGPTGIDLRSQLLQSSYTCQFSSHLLVIIFAYTQCTDDFGCAIVLTTRYNYFLLLCCLCFCTLFGTGCCLRSFFFCNEFRIGKAIHF